MNRLHSLRSQLALMSWARIVLRWCQAIFICAVALLAILLVLFGVDYFLERVGLHTAPIQRGVLLGVALLAWLAISLAAALPLLCQWESVAEMALMIEGKQQIDNDLIAALQFESPHSADWGSPQLQGAVIDYVADWGRGLSFSDGLADGVLRRWLLWLAAALLAVGIWAGLWLVAPVDIFLDRLWLGSKHYPSDTQIEAIKINHVVLDADKKNTPPVAEGQSVAFSIYAAGVIPKEGLVVIRSREGGESIPLKIKADEESPTTFRGESPIVRTSLEYQVFLGDAWTDAAPIEIVPLPLVKPAIRVQPPAYAASAGDTIEPTQLQLSVLEGSRVDLGIGASSKPLQSASLTLGEGAQQKVLPLEPIDHVPLAGGGLRSRDSAGVLEANRKAAKEGKYLGSWRLLENDPALERVAGKLEFHLQVVDADGLSLENPLRGSIRIKEDRKPIVTAEILGRLFTPEGAPKILVRLRDDYGIARLNLVTRISRKPDIEDNRSEESKGEKIKSGEDQRITEEIKAILVAATPDEAVRNPASATPLPLPLTGELLPAAGAIVVPLKNYHLKVGDQLVVVLEATDFRGDLPGETTATDQIVLEIKNASDVLADNSKLDKAALDKVTETLKTVTGSGDSK